MKNAFEKQIRAIEKTDRDLVALGIAAAAIILFVGTGGTLLPQIMRSWMGNGETPDIILTNAVLLNIALLILGWRRYTELQREVKSRRTSEKQARELANIDPLTQCLNRRNGTQRIDELRFRAMEKEMVVTVFMVDLDNFKKINDLHGHQMGDQVLKSVAARMRNILPTGSVLVRVGGDEFTCAFIHPLFEQSKIDDFASKLIADVSNPVTLEAMQVHPTISIGMTSTSTAEDETWSQIDLNAEQLMHQADVALYRAKSKGRNCFCRFDPQMEKDLRLNNELEIKIRAGMANGEFVPYYEQQIDLGTGKLAGFEMLARWHSPTLGVVKPEVFIPIAEKSDLIAELSEMLIQQAFIDAKEWDPELTLSVNISPMQMRDPWFVQKILHLVIETGFPPQRLEIEITESCVHQDIEGVRNMLSSLKNLGIKVSLDDFGTGYSNLAQLRGLQFDRLKIDRSFIAGLSHDSESRKLVEAIISLGDGLSLPLTAEGVESVDALEALRSMGQLKGQGFLYGRPEDAKSTRKRLRELDLLCLPKPAASKLILSEGSGANDKATLPAADCTVEPEGADFPTPIRRAQ